MTALGIFAIISGGLFGFGLLNFAAGMNSPVGGIPAAIVGVTMGAIGALGLVVSGAIALAGFLL